MTSYTNLGDPAFGRRTATVPLTRSSAYARAGIATTAAATLLILLVTHRPPLDAGSFILYVLLVAFADLFFRIRLAPGSYVRISPAFILTYFLMGGGIAAAAIAALSEMILAIGNFLLRRRTSAPLDLMTLGGERVLAILGGAAFAQLLLGKPALASPLYTQPTSALAAFALGYFLTFAAAESLIAFLSGGATEVRAAWVTSVAWTGVTLIANIPFAIVLRLTTQSLNYVVAGLLLLAVLGGIASALRLNVSLRQGNEELRALNRLGTLLNSTLDLRQLFRLLARETGRVFRWDGFFVAVMRPETSEIELVFLTEAGDEIAQRRIPRGAGLTGRAMETGELLMWEQGEKERGVDEETFRGRRRPRSVVVVPMRFGDQTIGAISLQSFRSDVYGARELRLLQTIGAQAAIALRNAQLYASEGRANRERDEFLSLVTHEIKNPLTSITGYADIASMSVEQGDSAGAVDAVRVIRDEAGKILRLTEDLLEVSRVTAGKFSVRMEPVDLPKIVRQVATRYERTSPNRFDLDIPENFPEMQGDSTRLTQVVENLVSNAVKYSGEAATIAVSLATEGSAARLMIRDTGQGIPPQKLPLIFERFYRVEEEGQTVKGTGLGLFITREIVRMHGGDIEAHSELGRGTTFTVRLPLRKG